MAKKKVNRKKLLKRQLAELRKSNREVSNTQLAQEEVFVHQALEQVKDMVAEEKTSAGTLEDFLALPELEGIAAARLETFFEAGIQSVADFTNHTEKELLALKGIGPATIKQLKEKGIALKG